jgi:FkbM family methyltransferase
MKPFADQPLAAGALAPSASAATAALPVRLGRRVATAPLPTQLERARALAKKLAWTAFEARLTTTPVRYARRELFGGGLGEYELRHSGGRFAIRHQSGDVDIFRKFYAYGYYEWPFEVAAALRRLGRPINTLDLGANIGFFEVHSREQLPVAGVVAFEPDPANGEMWDRVRRANGESWELVKACASNAAGTTRFRSGAHNFSRIDSDGDFEVPVADVFPYVERADLIKMNIEGSEWEILEDPRLAETDAIWFVEYHRIRNPEEDITASVRQLFERSGYSTRLAMSHQDNGLVWAWKDRTP